MNPNKPPLFTEHRRQRLALWALTVLGWLAAVLFGDRGVSARHLQQRIQHFWLNHITQTVTALLVARALQFANMRTRRRPLYWRKGRSLRRRHWMRSLLGARFRRLLKHKDFATHIAQLISMLRNLDTHARQLAHRMRRLHRLWRIAPRIAATAVVYGSPAPSPAVRDSS